MWCKLKVLYYLTIYILIFIAGPILLIDEWLKCILTLHAIIAGCLVVVGGIIFLENKCDKEGG